MSWFSRKKEVNTLQDGFYNPNQTSENQATTPPLPQNEQQSDNQYRPPVTMDDFVDYSDPNISQEQETQPTQEKTFNNYSTPVFDYKTGLPIDTLYEYMENDWESQGKLDAISNPDITYMSSKVEIIKQGLQRRFDLVRLTYNGNIRRYKAQMENLQTFGMTTTLTDLEAFINTCEEHLQKIIELEEKFKNDDPSLRSMAESYKRGFANGVAERTRNEIENLKSL